MRPPEAVRALCVAGATTLLALLAQLGYVVIAPDDLGLGLSSARHQVRRAIHCPPPPPRHPSAVSAAQPQPTHLDARHAPSRPRPRRT